MKRAFFAALVAFGCQSNHPAVEAPTVAETNDASAKPVASVAPPPSAAQPDVAATAGRLVTALNAPDLETARAIATPACWEKECSSLAMQAVKKFKVKPKGDPKRVRLHAVLDLEILCGGTRPCDEAWVLFALDCAPVPSWRAEDVTENEAIVRAWLENAPSGCQ